MPSRERERERVFLSLSHEVSRFVRVFSPFSSSYSRSDLLLARPEEKTLVIETKKKKNLERVPLEIDLELSCDNEIGYLFP